MSIDAISAKGIPSWFGQLAVGVALAGGGAWLLGEHNRINEIERRANSTEVEQSRARAQLDLVVKAVDKLDDKLDKGFAAVDRRLEQLVARPR